MNKFRIAGLLLVALGIILNQLDLENDLADFAMGIAVGLGLGFLIYGSFKKTKSKEK